MVLVRLFAIGVFLVSGFAFEILFSFFFFFFFVMSGRITKHKTLIIKKDIYEASNKSLILNRMWDCSTVTRASSLVEGGGSKPLPRHGLLADFCS